MNLLEVWQASLFNAWAQVGPLALNAVVVVFAAAVVFSVSLVAAYWVRRLIVELLKAAQLEQLSQAAGFSGFLKRADIRFTTTDIVGEFVRWVIVLVGFIAAVNVLGLQPVVDVLMQILGYIPSVFAAALIIAAGFFIARLGESLVRGALASVDHEAARPVSRLTYWVIIVLSFFAALSQLQIAEALTEAVFQTLSWATALALGLLVGLGGKELLSKVLVDWYDKIRR
ncbi:hypothetical protein HYZ78_00675 [Candidatus Microgenomates bacterium]|nr:hypothetical protein [Candidatus Microgenomates bacterium]